MIYELREIKDNEFVSFILNPFKSSAKLGDDIIQKYRTSEKIDELFVISKQKGAFKRIGIVFYDCKEIMFWDRDYLKKEMNDTIRFKNKNDANYKIRSLILKKLEEYRINNLEEIKKTENCQRIYKNVKSKHFDSLVFQELGTTNVRLRTSLSTGNKIDAFLEKLPLNDLIDILNGNMNKVNLLVHSLSDTEDFLEQEIVQPWVKQEAKDYVKTGVFTDREKLLIDYLSKVTVKGIKSVTVQAFDGSVLLCYNQPNCSGQLFAVQGFSRYVDIADIEMVIYDGEVLYKGIAV